MTNREKTHYKSRKNIKIHQNDLNIFAIDRDVNIKNFEQVIKKALEFGDRDVNDQSLKGRRCYVQMKILVTYYSWSGTTKRLTKKILKQLPEADEFEIKVSP